MRALYFLNPLQIPSFTVTALHCATISHIDTPGERAVCSDEDLARTAAGVPWKRLGTIFVLLSLAVPTSFTAFNPLCDS